MQNRLLTCLEKLQTRQEGALIGYLPAGDPDLKISVDAMDAVIQGGADILEIGIPFSDPLADGPAIQAAGVRALRAGFRLECAFEAARNLRQRHSTVPILLMTYANPVLRCGPDIFATKARQAGVDGLLIPDVPLEETGPFESVCLEKDLILVSFAAPTTGKTRLQAIASGAQGFIYTVALTGVTGSGAGPHEHLRRCVQTLKKAGSPAVMVGFGISTPEDVHDLAGTGDGVVVGTAFVRTLQQGLNEDPQSAIKKVRGLAQDLKNALRTR